MSVNLPGPWWLVAACTLAGVPLGLLLVRELATTGYRMEDQETGPVKRGLPVVAVAVPVAWGLLAWQLGGVAQGTVLPALMLYAVIGIALSWIDIDVFRLPEGLTFPLAWSLAGLLALASLLTGDWGALVRALVSGVLCFVAYLVLLLLSRGQFSFGDVVLGAITGLLLGWLGWREPWWALAAAFVASAVVLLPMLLVRRIKGQTFVPFGPFIVVGALVCVLALR